MHRIVVAVCGIAAALVVGSCSTAVELDGVSQRAEAELIAEIWAAQEEATACRKVIDKPVRCLP